MTEQFTEHHEYDEVSDLLDVYFGEKRAAWTIELTDHIMLSLDKQTGQAISLSFLDFTELIRPTPLGLPSFPLTGLAALPLAERDLVIHTLTTPPVNNWLDISVVQTMPDSPFIVTHLSTSSQQVLNLIPAAA